MRFDAAGAGSGAPDVADLVSRAQAGDQDAFVGLVRLHEGRVVTLLGRLLDDHRDVEEAAQDTFVQAWRNLHRYRGDAALSTWLHRIATNVALMRLRRRRPVSVALHDVTTGVDDVPPFEDAVVAGLVALAPVRAALADLPPDQRVVVVLRDVEGFTNDEVADVLELPVSTVKTRLHRGRQALRRHLADTARPVP